LYEPHIFFQSKHGLRLVPVETAIVEAAAVAHFRCAEPKKPE
jgi:hypothetical protein